MNVSSNTGFLYWNTIELNASFLQLGEEECNAMKVNKTGGKLSSFKKISEKLSAFESPFLSHLVASLMLQSRIHFSFQSNFNLMDVWIAYFCFRKVFPLLWNSLFSSDKWRNIKAPKKAGAQPITYRSIEESTDPKKTIKVKTLIF